MAVAQIRATDKLMCLFRKGLQVQAGAAIIDTMVTPIRDPYAVKPRNNRSKVSNGSRLFVEPIDGRTATGRRFRDLLGDFTSDLGGLAQLSEGQKQLVRRSSLIGALCEKLEVDAVLEKATFDLDGYIVLTNCQRRLCETLGLRRVQRQVNAIDNLDSIKAYLDSQKGAQAASGASQTAKTASEATAPYRKQQNDYS